jgi:hypothetical protein
MESRIDKITRELDEWIEALKSGNYKQGRYQLKSFNFKSSEFRYCCLGVLADINDIEIFHEGAALLSQYTTENNENCVIKHFTNTNNDEFNQMMFAQLNDIQNKSFEEIADYILENKEKFINIIDYELNKKGF